MSSITTAVPSGIVKDWCLATQADFEHTVYQCANSTLGQTASDFETICCDGTIIDTTQDLIQYNRQNSSAPVYIEIDNLVCCRLTSPQPSGIAPIVSGKARCASGHPTPLASLAATNTNNAALFPVTHTGKSFGPSTTGDYIPTHTPTCVWMNTNTALPNGAAVKVVTVPAAERPIITAITTNADSFSDSPSQTGEKNRVSSVQTSSPKPSSPSSSAATRNRASQVSLGGMLGVAAIAFLLYPFTLV
jgi:hypothetical protein